MSSHKKSEMSENEQMYLVTIAKLQEGLLMVSIYSLMV